jgi:hypothetical protein
MGEQNLIPTVNLQFPNLADNDEVWRRVPPEKVIFDSNIGTFRPTKDSFNDHPNGTPMSAFLARECRDPQAALEGNEGFALVAIRVQTIHECNQVVVSADREGLPPGHVHITGKKTDSVRKKFAKECRWVVEPSDELKEKARKRALGQD